MTPLRFLRIAGIAAAFFVAFTVSQAVTVARTGETIPGIHFAIAALAVFFLVGAWATERTQGPRQNARKDLLWGLGAGGLAIFAIRLLS
ncbi:MAG: hypothetical protein B6D46_04710 [Polyangiaceae bacterium UTPRO1]|nr:hypothetical protein [Myxococcales bacterium]OQY67980.1 MAG: hypothetical protein B6D46_04710 [Polyangiaceae bacterium UTPRO1]